LEPEREQAINKLKSALESKTSLADPFVQCATEATNPGDYEKAEGEMAFRPEVIRVW
jgi:hypothetical protein